jgi:hypothetical protein
MSGLSILKRAECQLVKIPGLDNLPHQQTTTMFSDRAVVDGNSLTDREVADEVGNSIGSCHQILTEKLLMRRVICCFSSTVFWQNKDVVSKP